MTIFLSVTVCTVAFICSVLLIKEVVDDYHYCVKKREQERDENLKKLSKQLKM